MAGDRSWFLIGGLAVLALGRAACTPAGPGPDDGFDRAALLGHLGDSFLRPAATEFVAAAGDLQAAAEAWRDGGSRGEAQEAWRAAMGAWQRIEVAQVGPLGSSVEDLGGEDLRDEVYSWPTSSPCQVDQQLVADGFGAPGWFDGQLVNTYGLDALEYLLFVDGGENDCPPQIAINSDGTWDALGEAEVDARRARYAAAAAAHLVSTAADVEQAVSDWSTTLAAAGEPGSPFVDAHEAVNSVYDALFYVELVTKDRKLGRPLGRLDCAQTTCPEDVESPWSGTSLRWIEANLEAFGEVFTGGEGLGLDDLLAHAGEQARGDEALVALDAALAIVGGLPDSLADALPNHPQELDALHDRLAELGDLLKGDLAIALTLQVPSEAAGDND